MTVNEMFSYTSGEVTDQCDDLERDVNHML